MSKISVTVFLFLLIMCASRLTESKPVQSGVVCKTPGDMNPNGSSELSLLMRKMYDHAAAARKNVLAKKLGNNFPKEFLSIYTAKPTDSTTKNPSFDPFATGYLQSLNEFKGSTQADLVENYNNLVNACISCHSQHCPGPVSKMKKLLIETAQK